MSKPGRWGWRLVAMAAVVVMTVSCSAAHQPDLDSDASATPRRGGVLHVADEREASSLNPYIAQDNYSVRAFSQILEPLFRTDTDGKAVPWLAQNITPSNDLTSWTIELRPGVEFSDGAPMTVDDVVYSIDAVRNSESWAAMFAEIQSVAPGPDSTVVIKTAVPSPALPISLSLPFAAIVPKDLRGMSPEDFGLAPIGTGPFKVESWRRGQELTLMRNPAYWDPERPYLDELVFEAVPGDSSRAQQLRGGALDVIASPPRPQLVSLDRAPGTRVGQYALATPTYMALNQKSPTFADPRMREAVDYGIDRASVQKAASSGVGSFGGSFLAPALLYYDESLDAVDRDPERARRLLDQAVAAGVRPTMSLMIVAGDSYQNIAAQIIKENLEDVGFSVRIDQVDGATLLSESAAGNYDATINMMTSDILDPSEVVGFYLDLDGMWTGGETIRTRKLLDAAKQEADDSTRRDLYHQIQRIVYDDRSLITLGYQPWIWAARDDVVGFDVPMTGIPWFADAGFRNG
jgi:peptide/nickel transport system substrate-binding protein